MDILKLHNFKVRLLLVAILPYVVGQQQSAYDNCPIQCDPTFSSPAAWTYYYKLNELDSCDGVVLFQMNIYNDVDDPDTHIYYRACTAATATQSPERLRRQVLALNDTIEAPVALEVVQSGARTRLGGGAQTAGAAVAALQRYVQQSSDRALIAFAKSGDDVAGLFAGSQIDRASAALALNQYRSRVSTSGLPQQLVAQSCRSSTSNETIRPEFFGIIVNADGNVGSTQRALRTWSDAKCLSGDSSGGLENVKVDLTSGTEIPITPAQSGSVNDDNKNLPSRLAERQASTCSFTQVQAGDGCWAISERCGVSLGEVESFNGGGDFCDTLKLDQYVCCSRGSLPDFTPQPGGDGSCFAYTVESGDFCASIAESHQMTVEDIEGRNDRTWGWQGCENLFLGMKICLSSGRPPFPANVPNAVCGPQSNDTEPTGGPSTWTDLNPCPLNACCNIFGQCGVTSEFCTANPADTGNPGTAQPGSNGCISNCGTEIVTGGSPGTFERVGYFEAFHKDRSCLHMAISDIPDRYTVVHWAFADITDDYQISIAPYENDWKDFIRETRFRKIVSFGGWAFSTEYETYPILREAVRPENRQRFADNVARFARNNNLDGVDFDWEYPGAPDNQGEGIPLDDTESPQNYLEFLRVMRRTMDSSQSLAIAAPASYWYLKAFPIDKMGDVLDYIIYMTYDLHGQWDYGNKFTSPGCPAGNCLRSHINNTETETAFSMITKAGVPANKIIVGQPFYGRSFKMTTSGCYTERCTFAGPESGARPGRCTDTAGYISNFEIREILASQEFSVEQYYSPEAGDILVYDQTEWVSWVKPSTYDLRSEWAQGLGMGGTSDWAIDLDISGDGSGGDDGDGSDDDNVVIIDPSIYEDSNPEVTCRPPCTFVLPPWTLPYTTTITPSPVTSTVLLQWPSVSTGGGGVTSTLYVSKTTMTTITLAPVTTTEIPVWNVEWTSTDELLTLTSSVILPPVTLTQQSTVITTSGTTTTIPGITYSYSYGPYPSRTAPDPGETDDPVPPPPTGCDFCPPIVTPRIGLPGPICRSGCGNLCDNICSPGMPCLNLLGCGCIGLGCPSPGCIGPGCVIGPPGPPGGGGGGEGDGEEPTSCSTSVTATDCSVGCSVFPEDEEYSTSCYTTSCTDNVGCRPTGTTITEETTEACLPETPGPRPRTGQVPILGGGGGGGSTWDGSDGGGGNPGPTSTPDPEDDPEDESDDSDGDSDDDSNDDSDDSSDDDSNDDPEGPDNDPPEPNTILWIFNTMIPTPSFLSYSFWWHSRATGGGRWSICEEDNDRPCGSQGGCNDADGPNGDGTYPFPDGEYEMFRGRSEGCVYEGTSDRVGTLDCPGFDEPVRCTAVRGREGIPCQPIARFEEVAYCEYYKP